MVRIWAGIMLKCTRLGGSCEFPVQTPRQGGGIERLRRPGSMRDGVFSCMPRKSRQGAYEGDRHVREASAAQIGPITDR